MKESGKFFGTAMGTLLALSLAANVWLAVRLRNARATTPNVPEPAPPAQANPQAPAKRPGLTLVSWEYKITTMKTDLGTAAARFIEGYARNDSGVEAGETAIYFSLHDKDGAKVDDREVSIRRLGTNEVWKFKTEPFKYALTAKFSRFNVP